MSVDPVSIGVKVALTAATMAITASQRFEGPRLDKLDITTAAYGTPYPIVWAYRRVDGCIIAFSEPLREKKVESKTKGGKYTNYKYYWTGFAAAAGHEVDSIAKIRMNNHLVFDLTKPGPISVASGFFQAITNDAPVKLTQGKNLRIYLGTETQEVDPRYAAWCEDRYGPDSATARRGIAGAMFEEIPLEKFGNVVPQISMDVIRNKSPAYLYETITPGGAVGPIFSADRSRAIFYNIAGNDYAIWDVPTRTKVIDSTLPINGEDLVFDASGRIWGLGGTLGSHIRCFGSDGLALLIDYDMGVFTDDLQCVGSTLYMRPYAGVGTAVITSDGVSVNQIGVGFTPAGYFGDLDGNAWTVGLDGTDIRLVEIHGAGSITVASPGGATGNISAFVNSDGDFFVIVHTTLVLIDASAGTIIDSRTIVDDDDDLFQIARQMLPGSGIFYAPTQSVSTTSLATLQTYTLSNWTGGINVFAYEPGLHAFWTSAGIIAYLDRVSGVGMTVGDIVEDVAEMCGIDLANIVTTDLTQPVTGYSAVQGQGAEMIAPLLEIHDSDCVPHDHGLLFRVRGDASDELIESEDFVSGGDARFDLSIVNDALLPARVEFNYADHTADQQPNTASDSLNLSSVTSQRKKVFDLTTYASEPDEAQPLVERYLRRQWFEREQGEAKLSVRWAKLEPGDVKTIEVDGNQRVVRFTELTRQGAVISGKWVRDDPRIHDQSASSGPTFDGREEETIYIASPAKAQVFDIPYLSDAHNTTNPLIYYAAGKYAGNFPGAVIWTGDFANDEFEQWNAIESSEGAIWGYAETALGDANPWLWDRGNSIVVHLKGGTPTSVTEAEINADPTLNQAVIGAEGRWEVVNFTTATLLGNGRWQISGFKRGRRGTEWAVSLHEKGDEFWLAEDLKRDDYGLSEVGTDQLFKGQSLGRDLISALTLDIDLDGASLKPYAPASLTWSTDGTDLTGTIIRRTRVGGAWTGGSTIPLSESSEEYEVDILSGASVVRTITVTGTNTFTYTSAQMSTDGNTASSPPDVNVYQMSDAVGRGFALAA